MVAENSLQIGRWRPALAIAASRKLRLSCAATNEAVTTTVALPDPGMVVVPVPGVVVVPVPGVVVVPVPGVVAVPVPGPVVPVPGVGAGSTGLLQPTKKGAEQSRRAAEICRKLLITS